MLGTTSERSQSWLPLALIAGLLLVLYYFWNVLFIFILAALFAFIVYPLVRFLDRRFPHILSIITVYLVILILLTVVVGLLLPVVIEQFRSLIESIPAYVEQARSLIDSLQEQYVELPARWRSVVDNALVQLQQGAVQWTQQTIPAVLGVVTGLFTLIFVPLLAFFMLLDSRGYKEMLIAILPGEHRATVNDLLACMGRSLWDFIKGEFILMTVVGLVTGFGLYLVGMPYPVVFGVIAGLLEVIPNFGPVLTTILVGLVAVVIDPILALKAVGLTVVVQLLENALLAPLVMAKAVGLDPVTVALAIFLGGSLAGVLGALIAIPLAVMVKIAVLYFYAREKDLPGDQNVCQGPDESREEQEPAEQSSGE